MAFHQEHDYVQGGAMNHGLPFAGPPPPALWGLWEERLTNPLGGRLSDGINGGAAVGGHQFPCSIAGCQLIAEIFVRDRPFTKVWVGPTTSRSLIPKMKKLLDDRAPRWQPGPYVMAMEQKKAMRADWAADLRCR